MGGLGQRTTKLATTGGNTVVTHYDYDKDGKYLGQLQLNPDGTYAQGDDYIWLDDMPIAQIRTTYGANNAIASQQLTYIHADHLNTPRAMTDASKKVVWKWESEAYGRTAPNSDPDGDTVLNKLDLRFPGQIADAETGLFYNNARYYDPITGRYTQSDPIGLDGGPNTYIYANDNPVSYVDPLGLEASVGGWVECGPTGKYVPRRIRLSPLQEKCGVGDCMMEHEKKHITDLINDGDWQCRIAPSGHMIRYPSAYEKPAYKVELGCLSKKLSECDKNCDSECKSVLQQRINDIHSFGY